VRDRDGWSGRRESAAGPRDPRPRWRIHRARRLVQDHRPVGDSGATSAIKLTLAHRQLFAPSPDSGVRARLAATPPSRTGPAPRRRRPLAIGALLTASDHHVLAARLSRTGTRPAGTMRIATLRTRMRSSRRSTPSTSIRPIAGSASRVSSLANVDLPLAGLADDRECATRPAPRRRCHAARACRHDRRTSCRARRRRGRRAWAGEPRRSALDLDGQVEHRQDLAPAAIAVWVSA
jgi:hypothetical protein